MPRKSIFTKEQILAAAFNLTREKGFSAVSARSLAAKLGTSSQPIFRYFKNIEDLKNSIINAAKELYSAYLKEGMESGKYSPYKGSGMAYIRFATEEKELFKLLFMCDRTGKDKTEISEETEMLSEIICKQVNISKDDAMLFYLEMWAYVHGIAVMIATNFYDWNEELCSKTLTDMYQGLKYKYENKN